MHNMSTTKTACCVAGFITFCFAFSILFPCCSFFLLIFCCILNETVCVFICFDVACNINFLNHYKVEKETHTYTAK